MHIPLKRRPAQSAGAFAVTQAKKMRILKKKQFSDISPDVQIKLQDMCWTNTWHIRVKRLL